MKTLTKVLVVIVAVGFLFSVGITLNAADQKAPKADKAKAKCCSAEKCCAACNTKIAKDAPKLKGEYKGKTYYFGTEKCKAAFEKDPEKFIAKCKAAQAKCCKADAKCCDASVQYTCPMKQCKVTQDKAGKCPKCGMDLKKVVNHAENCPHHKHDQKDKDGKHDHKGHDHKH